MKCNSPEQAQGYHDFYESIPCPYERDTRDHRRWCTGWILAANESGAIPDLPADYELELVHFEE